MVPLPTISLIHPLSNKRVHLEVMDLSGSGLSVREEVKHALLLPGLIIPDLEICFGEGTHVSCSAQVVYSRTTERKKKKECSNAGLPFLTCQRMSTSSYSPSFNRPATKMRTFCNRVNLDDLWDFFFETGFIYPQKYEFIEKNKTCIKKTYKKLYTESPKIARHFIHQRNGQILAHMAMVRFYGKAWLIHHHAAIRSSTNRGGLAVLNQIGSFINDSHRLNSIKMNYVFCYFRPENKFPNHVFGGATKNIKNPKGCSIDQFAFFHFRKNAQEECTLPVGWRLEPATGNDLRDLECHYEEQPGGLMIHALDLCADNHDISETETAFSQIGLVRSRHLYALKMAGTLKAVIMIDIADMGLNMSDLTSSAKIFILKHEEMSHSIIKACLLGILDRFGVEEIPVLAYPAKRAESLNVPIEKHYNLWILSMNHTDDYFRYLKRLLKFIKH
jgi:hypothetical protein